MFGCCFLDGSPSPATLANRCVGFTENGEDREHLQDGVSPAPKHLQIGVSDALPSNTAEFTFHFYFHSAWQTFTCKPVVAFGR